jgi:hypothetical protein
MRSDDVWYFAYGANMSSRVLAGRRGVHPAASEAARLNGHRLVFDLRGVPHFEPGFASVQACARGECADDDHVEGVLYRLRARDLRVVEVTESSRYRWLDVVVEGRDAGRVQARTLQNLRPTAGLVPSRRYLALLIEGAREHALSDAWIAKLEAHPCAHVPILSPLFALFAGATMRAGTAVRAISRLR